MTPFNFKIGPTDFDFPTIYEPQEFDGKSYFSITVAADALPDDIRANAFIQSHHRREAHTLTALPNIGRGRDYLVIKTRRRPEVNHDNGSNWPSKPTSASLAEAKARLARATTKRERAAALEEIDQCRL